ncbi:MAG: lipocalin family protein [Myxococcota bacterium]
MKVHGLRFPLAPPLEAKKPRSAAAVLHALSLALLLGSLGCQTMNRDPIPTVAHVDLDRFMGDWYVIGVIPTWFELDAHNAVERYSRNPDGTIATDFSFRKGSFDGPLREYHPKGFVRDDPSNAVWGMQFVWPIKAEYRIVHLDDAYSITVVARNERDHAWIMAREPTLSASEYEARLDELVDWGYDRSEFVRVPHRW